MKKIAAWCKVDDELLKQEFMEVTYVLARRCVRAGIDLTKPYTVETGYTSNDFVNNRVTIIVTQFTDETPTGNNSVSTPIQKA